MSGGIDTSGWRPLDVGTRTCALGLHLGRLLSSYDHRVRPTNIFHAIDGQGVLSVPDVRGKELELRYYIHDEAVPVGAFEVDADVWLHPGDDVGSDAEDPVSDTESRWVDAGILKGLVVYNPWEPSTIRSAPRWAAGAYGSGPRCDTCWKPMGSVLRTLILTGTRGAGHNSGSAASIHPVWARGQRRVHTVGPVGGAQTGP